MSTFDKRLKIISVLIVFVIYLFLAYYDDPDAVRHEKKLQSEFINIIKLPIAKEISYHSDHEIGLASVGAKYNTNASYLQIKRHYDREFSKNGWAYKGERDLRDWGDKIPGGKIIYYEKEPYDLSFQYEGNYRSFTYSISLSWDPGN